MDGRSWLEIGESAFMFPSVSLSRGRLSLPDTFPSTSFTRDQLDAVAPLCSADRLSLREHKPTEHAKEVIRSRIEAARNLKYRQLHEG